MSKRTRRVLTFLLSLGIVASLLWGLALGLLNGIGGGTSVTSVHNAGYSTMFIFIVPLCLSALIYLMYLLKKD